MPGITTNLSCYFAAIPMSCTTFGFYLLDMSDVISHLLKILKLNHLISIYSSYLATCIHLKLITLCISSEAYRHYVQAFPIDFSGMFIENVFEQICWI